ncbi:MAG: Hint domain-containing protein [Pseudomonadota bacterium]
MSNPLRMSANSSNSSVTRRHKPWTVRSGGGSQSPMAQSVPLTRRYQVMWQDDDGDIQDFMRIGPAMPIFEDAFSAFAHGAIISTTEGPVAVEDLLPGMNIETASGEVEVLRWIGSITIVPGAPQSGGEPQRLYRIAADTFGLGRPSLDVTLGPSARLMNRDPAIRAALGTEAALAPVSTFADGVNVIELSPVSPVRVYHLHFDRHHVIKVGGVEVESYHPGADAHYSMSQEMREIFLGMFPHVATMQGFGRVLWPRFETQDTGEIEIV